MAKIYGMPSLASAAAAVMRLQQCALCTNAFKWKLSICSQQGIATDTARHVKGNPQGIAGAGILACRHWRAGRQCRQPTHPQNAQGHPLCAGGVRNKSLPGALQWRPGGAACHRAKPSAVEGSVLRVLLSAPACLKALTQPAGMLAESKHVPGTSRHLQACHARCTLLERAALERWGEGSGAPL